MPTSSKQTSKVAITVKNLTVDFNDYRALEDITCVIPEGSFTAIIGPNGSGKTTLLKAILGLIPHDGQIELGSGDYTLAYVPQYMSIDPTIPISALEFLTLHRKADEDINGVLKLVGLQKDILTKSFSKLSGGQKQRIILARALLKKPDILFLDEPIAHIDQSGERQIEQVLNDLHKKTSATIVLVSHDIHYVAKAVDHVICINKNLLCSGCPQAALSDKNIHSLFEDKHIHHSH
jgi:zinc transport system ATP-binding protein